jgi:UDP-N-acetylmuramoyl-L-alanyl-D-glutamate--2,6-diaminopimelate ligase
MNLSSLLRALSEYRIENARDIEITRITSDSRQVTPGALFVAYPGVSVDGARFIPDALQRGAVAIVAEHTSPAIAEHSSGTALYPLITVPNARAALARLAAAWYDFPSRKLRVIGVTGTDGKTTTCRLAASILTAAGHAVGTITTVAATIGDQEIDTGFHTTTPDAPDIQRYLARMVQAGIQYAVVEATSHGLAQRRLDAVEFDIAAVTNITHEHLDLHGTWESYRDAKAMLFRSLTTAYHKPRTAKVAVLNADDTERQAFEYLLQIPAEEQIAYGLTPRPLPPTAYPLQFIFARNVEHSPTGLRFTVVTPSGEMAVESPLVGRFNVSNILAAIGIAMARRVPFQAIQDGIGRVQGVTGRMEVIRQEPFAAIVDFAHTPNALRVALETAHETYAPHGRVIVVFGCAGLRDVAKRAWMGEIAGQLADKIVVTAEDPRTEPLDAINAQITEGLRRAGRRENEDYVRVDDRAEAIALAVKMAQPGDVVLVTGKGHERSMCFGTTEYPWSDQEAMKKALG